MTLLDLYNETVNIMREAKANYKNLGLMWAGGKDSTTMLYIAKEAYYNDLPKVIFLDTTFAFRETKEFIREIRKLWNIDLIYAQNREALSKGMNPYDYTKMECCESKGNLFYKSPWDSDEPFKQHNYYSFDN